MSKRKRKTKIPSDIKNAIEAAVADKIVSAIIRHLGTSEKENARLIYTSWEMIRAPNIANNVLKMLDEDKYLPIDVLEKILKCKRYEFVPRQQRSLEILTEKATSTQGESALKITIEQLKTSYPFMMLSFFALRNTDVGVKKLMKILIQKKPEIVLNLLRNRRDEIRTMILDLLMQVAKDDARLISLDMIETAFHSETLSNNLEKILAISDLINSFDPLKETVFVNTPYLVNWYTRHYLKECYFNGEIHIHRIIDELIKGIIGSSSHADQLYGKIGDLAKKSRSIDLLMFLPQKRYRGHDAHLLNVALFGLFLFEIYVNKDETLKKWASEKCGLSEKEFIRAWLIASLLHDHALPISYMFRVAPLINRFQNDPIRAIYYKPLGDLKKALEKSYSQLFSPKLDCAYSEFCQGDDDLEKFTKQCLKELRKMGSRMCQNIYREYDIFDHGFLAAVNISSILDKKPNTDKVIKNSLNAIALHNAFPNLDQKIRLSEDPIAFMLLLCDDLQEWGREIGVFPDILIEFSSIRLKFRLDEQKNLSFPEKLHIYFNPVTENIQNKKISFNQEFFINRKKHLQNILIFDTLNPTEIVIDNKYKQVHKRD